MSIGSLRSVTRDGLRPQCHKAAGSLMAACLKFLCFFCGFRLVLPITAGIFLTSCALAPISSVEKYKRQVEDVDIHSSFPIISRENIEQVNLVEMIDPENSASKTYVKEWSASDSTDGAIKYGVQYDLTLAWFRERSTYSAAMKKSIRNGVQEKMLAASTARCNVFKTFLQRDQSNKDFALGLGATVAGALGAILPGATASRNLAGTAGIFSGVRAEYDQAYYSNLASNIIVKAIEMRQSEVQTELRRNGQMQDIDAYSMEAAIRDAIYYDGQCSTVVALNYVDVAIKNVNNPGIVELSRIIPSVLALNKVANSPDISNLQSNGSLSQLQQIIAGASSPLAASTSGSSGVTVVEDPIQVMSLSSGQITSEIAGAANSVTSAYSTIYDNLAKGANTTDKAKMIAPADLSKAFTSAAANAIQSNSGSMNLIACATKVSSLLSTYDDDRSKQVAAKTDADKAIAAASIADDMSKIDAQIQRFNTAVALVKIDLAAAVTTATQQLQADKDSIATIAQAVPVGTASWPVKFDTPATAAYTSKVCP